MLKNQKFLFLLLIPLSLTHHISNASLSTILKYNHITKRMDGTKYNFLMNVEDFDIFEKINFKFFIKHNRNNIKVEKINYQFFDNEKVTFDSFNKLNNQIYSTVTTTSNHYYHYFKIEKVNSKSKYLLIQIELNACDPSNSFTLENTEKFEGNIRIIGFLILFIIFTVCSFGCCFGIFYGLYRLIKFLFPHLFFNREQFNNYSNNIVQVAQMNNNGYIIPVIPINGNNMNNYYMNYQQTTPQFININQHNFVTNLEQAPIKVVNDSNLNSSAVVTAIYEKP